MNREIMRSLLLYILLLILVLKTASQQATEGDSTTATGESTSMALKSVTIPPSSSQDVILEDSTTLIFDENDSNNQETLMNEATTATPETLPGAYSSIISESNATTVLSIDVADDESGNNSSAPAWSPTQEAIISELRDIWDYSMSLDETEDKELKTTLSNVVQLAYARVQVEPDETLHRLKYLLEKLRQRIGVSDSSSLHEEQSQQQQGIQGERIEPATGSITSQQHQQIATSATTQPDQNQQLHSDKNKEENPMLHAQVVPSSPLLSAAVRRRRRRSYGLGIGVGEVEPIPDSDENSIFSSYFSVSGSHNNDNNNQNNESNNNNNQYNYYEYDTRPPPVAPTLTPSDTTVQKVLVVQDRVTSTVTNEKPTRKPSVFFPQTTTTTTVPEYLLLKTTVIPPTVFYPPLHTSFLPHKSTTTKTTTSRPVQEISSIVPPQKDSSVDQIATEIVKLLYPPPNSHPVIVGAYTRPNTNPTPEFNFPADKDLFKDKLALLHKTSTTEPDLYPAYLQVHPLPSFSGHVENVPTTTLPPVLMNLIQNLKNQSAHIINDYFASKTTTTFQGLVADDDAAVTEASEKIMAPLPTSTERAVDSVASNNAPVSIVVTQPPTTIVQIMDELQSSNILKGPAAFMNGTREGFVQFIATLGTLSFTTKMVMVFALSISLLSIVLGVYSLGPPIIAVGILGIMIPIAILLLLQDSSRNNNNNSAQGKVTFNDQMSFILDLLDSAVDKYAGTNSKLV